MTRLAAVTLESHQDKYWQRFTSYRFAEKNNVAPLVVAEAYKAIQGIPMGFIRQNNRFIWVGLLSFFPEQNMFVDQQGHWLGAYVPSCFRAYPFQLARAQDRNDLVLCVDENSGLISGSEGEPFFDQNGQLSQSVKDILDFLSKIEQNRIITELAVSALGDAGLITEWNLKVNTGQEEKNITGLYRTDEARLNALDDETFLKLRKTGALPVAYAQLLSMVNINIFEKLDKIRGQASAPDAAEDTVRAMIGDDDLIRFGDN